MDVWVALHFPEAVSVVDGFAARLVEEQLGTDVCIVPELELLGPGRSGRPSLGVLVELLSDRVVTVELV